LTISSSTLFIVGVSIPAEKEFSFFGDG